MVAGRDGSALGLPRPTRRQLGRLGESCGPRVGLRGLCLLICLGCLATPPSSAAVSVRGRSGQFIIHSARPTVPTLGQLVLVGTNRTLLTLQPDPLAVSCERIKAGVLAELGRSDRWRGKIHVTIDPRARPVLFPTAVAVRYTDGWHYDLRLPPEIEGRALIRGVVHALLTEIANQHPGPTLPEVPLWLVEALAGQSLARIGPDPLARPNPITGRYGTSIAQLQAALRERQPANEAQALVELLRSRPLLTFEEITLPSPERFAGESAHHYEACARLLFASLRELPGGAQCFAAMLSQLPRHLNWQTAFLLGFRRHFSRMLDVEKWWALGTQRLLPLSRPSAASPAGSLLWLEDLLVVSAEVQVAPNLASEHRAVPLQTIISEWIPPLQPQILQLRLRQLRQLAPNLPPETQTLALAYAEVLEDFLAQRGLNSPPPRLGFAGLQAGEATRTAVARLDALDAQRRDLRIRLQQTAAAAGRSTAAEADRSASTPSPTPPPAAQQPAPPWPR